MGGAVSDNIENLTNDEQENIVVEAEELEQKPDGGKETDEPEAQESETDEDRENVLKIQNGEIKEPESENVEIEESESEKTDEPEEAIEPEKADGPEEAIGPEKTDEPEEAIGPEKADKPEEADKSEEDSETKETASKETEDSAEASETAAAIALEGDLGIYVDSSLFESQEKKQRRKRILKKIFAITAISILGLAVVGYFAIAVWFMFHFNYKTRINDIDVSFQSTDSVRQIMQDYLDNYKLTIYMRNDDVHIINPADINLSITSNLTEMDIKHEQNGLLWPFYIDTVKNYELTYTVTYDKELLKNMIMEYECLDKWHMTHAKNAYVTVEDGKAVIVKDKPGTDIDIDLMLQDVMAALDEGVTSVDLTDSECYKKAEITADSEEIENRIESLNRYLDMVIHFKIDEVSFDLKADTFGDWMYYEDGGWHFSSYYIKEYVGSLAEKYDTIGLVRKFKTYSGRYVEELGEDYGWVMDVEGETIALKEVLEKGNTCEHTPLFLQTGAAYNENNDIGDSYVEVDLTNQHVYMIIDGKLYTDTDCVTGCVRDGHSTPDGLYELSYKKSPAILKGEDYESNVTFWMPFNGGIGLHDATWRGRFGGEIYMNGGSHGCVNLPYSSAAVIYEMIYPGMPIICYY